MRVVSVRDHRAQTACVYCGRLWDDVLSPRRKLARSHARLVRPCVLAMMLVAGVLVIQHRGRADMQTMYVFLIFNFGKPVLGVTLCWCRKK